jgi:hypothetical protein
MLPKKRPFFVKTLVFFASCLIVPVLISVLILVRPSGYRPEVLTEEQGRHAEDYAIGKTQQVYNGVNRIEPFSLSLDEKEINRLILWVYNRWQTSTNGADPVFLKPQIRLAGNQLSVSGSVKYKGVSVVISVGFGFRIMQDGQLEIRLLPVKAGLIPLPRNVTDRYFREAAHGLARNNAGLWFPASDSESSTGNEKSDFDLWKTINPYVDELIENRRIVLPPEFMIDHEKQARITAVAIHSGRIDLTVKPVVIKYNVY